MEDLKPQTLRFRAIWIIIRASGLIPSTVLFTVLFLISSAIVAAVEPNIDGFGNACWLMFQVITTIGLGDYTCTTVIGRVTAVILSVYSVFFLAVITGTVVSHCTELIRARTGRSAAHFLDQLEHLDELEQTELTELSRKVKEFAKTINLR